MRELSDQIHPEAEKIIVALDNLNIHVPAAFYLAFEPEEARRKEHWRFSIASARIKLKRLYPKIRD